MINRERRRGPPIEPGFTVEVRSAKLHPPHVLEAEYGAVGIGPDHDVFEIGYGIEAALRLNVQLQPLVVGDRPRADAPHGGLHVLSLNGIDDIARGQTHARELVRVHPGPHRIVLRTPEACIADTGSGLDLVDKVDGGIVGDEERIESAFGRVDRDHAKQGGRLFLNRDTLPLHILGQLRQRHLNAVVHIDGIDIRVGAKLE